MNSVVRLFSICLLFMISESAFAQAGAGYYLPLSLGSQLNFHTEPAPSWGQRMLIYSIVGTDIIDGHECYRQVGVEINDITNEIDTFHIFWLRKDSGGNVIMSAVSINGSEDPDSAMVVNFNFFPNDFLTVGYSRTYSFGDISQDSVVSVTASVTASAGTFNNCIEILETQYDIDGAPIFREHHYYAKGVGMVKNVRTLPAHQVHIDNLISYVVTGQNDEVINRSPEKFVLSQNYPNPFNPTTKISWQSPVSSWQSLRVFDVLGNEVATLVKEWREAGNHSMQFDASGLSSGIYFYKLKAGNFIETRKMILLR